MPDSSAGPSPPPSPQPRGPGLRSFGGYEIEGELGRGGMGVVYLARQIELNRRVALKMLTGHYGPDELQRFLAEAETAAGLHHTNIAHIYEVGEHEGAPYFSMEYVEAGSLADRLRKELPSPSEAAQLLISVARALHFAHQNGVVHRDMKPGNVLLDPEGIPKVADFGIAKRLKEETHLTISGAVIGTPTYMAPEQAKGTSRHVGAAADVYSLGAILYEMLTGRPPFLPEDSETAITVRVLTEDPVSPAWHRPEIPRDLEVICMKCLEKAPRDRYESAAAFAEDLRRFLDDETIIARPPTTAVRTIKWVRRHPWKFITRAALLAITIGALVWIVHWDLYKRPRFEYGSSVDYVAGQGEPAGRISASAAERRQVSYRFTRQGRRGQVIKIEAVNSRGRPAAVLKLFGYDVLPNLIDGITGMQKFEERRRETTSIACSFIKGVLVEQTGLDCNGRSIWRMLQDSSAVDSGRRIVRARFLGGRGFEFAGRQGPASVAELERDAAGRERRVQFFNAAGEPAPNAEGVFGYELSRDEKGRVTRLMNLGRDGDPAGNREGVFGLALTWNSEAQITRSSYLDANGNTTNSRGITATEYLYDRAGNVVHTRFVDAEGRLANFNGNIAEMLVTRNERGEATEQVHRRMLSDGQMTDTSRRMITYDEFGYAADIRIVGATTNRLQLRSDSVGNPIEERWMDPNGEPVTGPNGWSIRRINYSETTDRPGWREAETYFDTKGAKTFSTSGHHRLISEFDQNGNLRRTIFEDNDPARFRYYRYVAEPEYDTRARLRRASSRYEDESGKPAAGAGRLYTSMQTEYDENERETLEWKEDCDLEALGAPVLKTETEWHRTGAPKRRIRQACDTNRKPLEVTSNGTAARFEEEFDEINQRQRIYETGFDEKLLGFSRREVKFSGGQMQSVTHHRSDGSILDSVAVFVRSITPEQPKAAELRAGDQLVMANDVPVTSAYGWVFGNFQGGWIELIRNGRRVRIDGFNAGSLGVVLEDRSPQG